MYKKFRQKKKKCEFLLKKKKEQRKEQGYLLSLKLCRHSVVICIHRMINSVIFPIYLLPEFGLEAYFFFFVFSVFKHSKLQPLLRAYHKNVVALHYSYKTQYRFQKFIIFVVYFCIFKYTFYTRKKKVYLRYTSFVVLGVVRTCIFRYTLFFNKIRCGYIS